MFIKVSNGTKVYISTSSLDVEQFSLFLKGCLGLLETAGGHLLAPEYEEYLKTLDLQVGR